MKIEWWVLPSDVDAVRGVLHATKHAQMVVERKQNNVEGKAPEFSPEGFWRVVIGCLLSTQQRWSVVSGFLARRPFPLALGNCDEGTVESLVLRELEAYGGIRFGPTIASHAAHNLAWLNAGGWRHVESHFRELVVQRSRSPRPEDAELERRAADFVDENLKGFGPKQARNLWQDLGLTRYEIPLDSRITKWVNANEILPFKLTAEALADRAYYGFVMEALQELCGAAGVLPCLFDAAVFSIKDQDG